MFYKFINETKIQKAPKPLKIDGKDVFTNSEQIHNEQGYYKLIQTDYPQDDKYYEPRYELQSNIIVQSWVETIINDI
jgi:hypothetical protein